MQMPVQIAVQTIRRTFHTFELKRRMSNIIAMIKDLIDLSLNLRPSANMQIGGEDMRGHRAQALRDACGRIADAVVVHEQEAHE